MFKEIGVANFPFPEHIYSSEIGRNVVQANFLFPEHIYSSEINMFKEIGVANFPCIRIYLFVRNRP